MCVVVGVCVFVYKFFLKHTMLIFHIYIKYFNDIFFSSPSSYVFIHST